MPPRASRQHGHAMNACEGWKTWRAGDAEDCDEGADNFETVGFRFGECLASGDNADYADGEEMARRTRRGEGARL